jgi:hypothetical protein
VGRAILAFAVAPLWLPAVATLAYLFRNFPIIHPLMAILEIWPAIIAIAAVGYLLTFLFGVPAFLLLRRRGPGAPFWATLVGLLVGVLGSVILTVMLTPFFWHDLRHKWPQVLKQLVDAPFGVIMPGLSGALIALTIACIARPRAPKSSS